MRGEGVAASNPLPHDGQQLQRGVCDQRPTPAPGFDRGLTCPAATITRNT